MSDPPIAPHPHPKQMRFSWAQIIVGVLALLAAIVSLTLNYLKPSTNAVTASGGSAAMGTNNGTAIGTVSGGAAVGTNNGTAIGTLNINASPIRKDEADPGLFVECYQRVRTARIPADGRIFLMTIYRLDDNGGLGVLTGNPATDYPLPGGMFATLRCSVTNYGVPRVNVLFYLDAVFSELVREGTTARSGKTLAERNLAVHIGKLETGKENQFDFYITNLSDYFVQIDLPNEATTQALGSDETKTIKVAWPKAYTRIVFNPISTIPPSPQ
jgi:hypothetical protein